VIIVDDIRRYIIRRVLMDFIDSLEDSSSSAPGSFTNALRNVAENYIQYGRPAGAHSRHQVGHL
jgi:hypothetical protein